MSPAPDSGTAGRRRFVDSASIHVRAGRGGHGATSFRHEPFVPRGGPDGGDGGHGGSVLAVADPSLSSLEGYARKRNWSAEDGANGAGSRKEGRSGHDLVLKVPAGTVVLRQPDGTVMADLDRPGVTATVARGGAGGRGNVHFATPSRRAPRFAEPGQPGEEVDVRLELRLIADVGLVGVPNAGKSSLLAALSAARPKVAAYPFTTLEPVLGVTEAAQGLRIVLADIPGLIEGASRGAGLGLEFLRHLERTRVLVYVVDGSVPDPWQDLDTVRREVRAYSRSLFERPSLVAVNKLDLEPTRALRSRTRRRVMFVSALTGEGLPELVDEIAQALRSAPPREVETAAEPPVIALKPRRQRDTPVVRRNASGFEVHSERLEKLLQRTDLDSEDGLAWFQVQLDRLGVTSALEEAGVAPGDSVRVGDVEFEYQPG